ncbi:hypothetical protein PFISCL1PPCAC_25384, partial [Pristionchus fissidentatus]
LIRRKKHKTMGCCSSSFSPKPTGNSRSNLESMPLEILSHIFSYLHVEDRDSVAQSSRALASAVANSNIILTTKPIEMVFRQVSVVRPGADDITEVNSKGEMFLSVDDLLIKCTKIEALDELLGRVCNKVRAQVLDISCDDLPTIPLDMIAHASNRFIYKEIHVTLNRRIPRNLAELCDRFACKDLCLTHISPDQQTLLALPPMNRVVGILESAVDDSTLLALVAQQKHRSLTVIADLVDPNTVVSILQSLQPGGKWSFLQFLVQDSSMDRVLALFGYRQSDYVEGSLAHYQKYSWRLFTSTSS